MLVRGPGTTIFTSISLAFLLGLLSLLGLLAPTEELAATIRSISDCFLISLTLPLRPPGLRSSVKSSPLSVSSSSLPPASITASRFFASSANFNEMPLPTGGGLLPPISLLLPAMTSLLLLPIPPNPGGARPIPAGGLAPLLPPLVPNVGPGGVSRLLSTFVDFTTRGPAIVLVPPRFMECSFIVPASPRFMEFLDIRGEIDDGAATEAPASESRGRRCGALTSLITPSIPAADATNPRGLRLLILPRGLDEDGSSTSFESSCLSLLPFTPGIALPAGLATFSTCLSSSTRPRCSCLPFIFFGTRFISFIMFCWNAGKLSARSSMSPNLSSAMSQFDNAHTDVVRLDPTCAPQTGC